jgi:hypothetical protein
VRGRARILTTLRRRLRGGDADMANDPGLSGRPAAVGPRQPPLYPNLLNLLADMGVQEGDDPGVGRLLNQLLAHQDPSGRFPSFAASRAGAAGSRCQLPASAWPVGGAGVVDESGAAGMAAGGLVDGASVTTDAAGCRSLRWPSHQPPPTSAPAVRIPTRISPITRCWCRVMSCPFPGHVQEWNTYPSS